MSKWVSGINGWTLWMTAAGLSPATMATRRYQLGRVAEAHLRRSPWRLTISDLAAWLGSQDWNPATLRTYRSALRSFYRWARITGHVHRDPAELLPRVRVPSRQPRPAPEPVLHAAMTGVNDRDRMILTLGAFAGLRRAEIAGLRWDHVTDTHLRITGKGSRTRHVPIRRELAAELTREQNRREAGGHGSGYRYSAGVDPDDGYVFPGRLGGHLAPAVIGRAATCALGDGWSAHTLRHRFATRAYAGTHDLLAVQQLLGHASPDTTKKYTEVSDGALTAAVEAV